MTFPVSFILLFGISGGEIFVIMLLVLILFGPKKIPEIARAIGKGINEVKKVQRDINNEINRYSNEIDNPVKDIKEDIEGFSKGLEDEAKSIERSYRDSKNNPNDDLNADQSVPENTSDELPYPYNQTESQKDKKNNDSGEDARNKNSKP
ncbi:MAG: Sec-independent protein translocase subunit TatA/TatB [Bacteroidota bacterium]